jgi:hypothetical protein
VRGGGAGGAGEAEDEGAAREAARREWARFSERSGLSRAELWDGSVDEGLPQTWVDLDRP